MVACPFRAQVALPDVPDVGVNYFTELYQMLKMIGTVYIYHTNMSAITHLPGMFLPLDLLWEHRNERVTKALPWIVFHPN